MPWRTAAVPAETLTPLGCGEANRGDPRGGSPPARSRTEVVGLPRVLVVWGCGSSPSAHSGRPSLPSSSLGATPIRDDQLDDVRALTGDRRPSDLTPAPAGKQCRLGFTRRAGRRAARTSPDRVVAACD